MEEKPESFLERIFRPDYKLLRSRRVAFAAAVGGAVLAGAVVLIPNTVGIDWMKPLFQTQRNGVAVVPNPKLWTLTETVKSDLQCSKSTPLKIFCCDYALSETFGSLDSPFGLAIGVPSYLNADTADQVLIPRDLSYDLQKLPEEEREEALAIWKELSLLSQPARLYVIAEGMEYARNQRFFLIPTITSSGTFVGTCLLWSIMKNLSRLKNMSFIGRMVLFGVCGSISTTLFIVFLQYFRASEYLNVVPKLSEKYVDGGIEFYEKLLKRLEITSELFKTDWLEDNAIKNIASYRLEKLMERKKEFS